MNALWVWIPLVLLYDSWCKITAACALAKTEGDDGTPAGRGWYTFVLATVALYLVLVPGVLARALYL
jgi:hypothetical protein